jgi:nicotinamide riboside kinase
MSGPLRIGLIGAESTGKTTLAAQLARATGGLWVPEYLRDFCVLHGRPPRADEQQGVIDGQIAREARALGAAERAGLRFVFCDAPPLMTAIYSELLFADASHFAQALAHQRRYAFTLFTQPDIGWQHDGVRDGPHVQQPVTERIAQLLTQHGIGYAPVSGAGPLRLQHALAALRAARLLADGPSTMPLS